MGQANNGNSLNLASRAFSERRSSEFMRLTRQSHSLYFKASTRLAEAKEAKLNKKVKV
jgi:hypothetical protein